MSKVYYSKKGSHPSKRFGECSSTTWPDHSTTEYPGVGASATSYNGDKAKTLHCNGGGGGKSQKEYRKKSRSFDTERGV